MKKIDFLKKPDPMAVVTMRIPRPLLEIARKNKVNLGMLLRKAIVQVYEKDARMKEFKKKRNTLK